MAASFGELLGGAGRIGRRGEQVGQELRDYERDRAALDQMRRAQALQAEISKRGLASQMAGSAPPAVGMVPGVQFGEPPVPGAPVTVPGIQVQQQPLPPGVQPSTAGAGRGNVNPPMAGQPQPTYPGAAAPAAATRPLTPDEIRQGQNRLALAKAPTAVLDVAQAPIAAGLNLGGAAVYGLQNAVGRGMNYLFGTNMPTDVQAPRYSMTPLYDRFVRQGEQRLASGVTEVEPPKGEAAAKPAAPRGATGKAASAPSKAAQQYDNKATPYDDLIQQSAQQYGVNPVVFKRLLGTESSFRPDPGVVVGANGQRHIGIAQISDLHGLSEADRLNPEVAIPFAAQLFSQYLQQTGGDYEEALMRYKGASSARGRAAMAKPVSTILSGFGGTAQAEPTPFKPAATPAKTADEVAKAGTYGVMYGDGVIDASPNNPMIQQVLTERQALVEKIQLMEQYGFGSQAMELLPQIRAIDLGLYRAQADQGLYEGETMGNFSRAMGVLSHFRQQPHQVLDRGDGSFDLYVGGKLARTGIDTSALADLIRSSVDESYRQQKAELAQQTHKSALKIQEILAEGMVRSQGNLQTALLEAEARLKQQRLINNKAQLLQLQSGQVALYEDGKTYIIDPAATTTMRGSKVSAPTRTVVP